MTLLPVPRCSGHDRKKGIRAWFSNLRMRCSLKSECELNHASRLSTLGVIKSKAKRTFWKGKLWGKVTIMWPTQLSLTSMLFEAFSIGNPFEGYGEVPMNLVSRPIQRWGCLNWKTTDKFNWQIKTRWRYRKWRTTEFFYRQLIVQITVKFSSVPKTQTKFPTTNMMLEKWLSYPNVTIQWILHCRWTTFMVGKTWET